MCPARTDIVISDAEATPVAHTFSPTAERNFDLFEDRAGGIAIGFPSITFKTKRPQPSSQGQNSSSRVYRIDVSLSLPVLEVTSPSTGTGIQPAPTVAYVLRFAGTFLMPERSILQDRKNLRKLVYNMLDNANVKKVVEDLEAWY